MRMVYTSFVSHVSHLDFRHVYYLLTFKPATRLFFPSSCSFSLLRSLRFSLSPFCSQIRTCRTRFAVYCACSSFPSIVPAIHVSVVVLFVLPFLSLLLVLLLPFARQCTQWHQRQPDYMRQRLPIQINTHLWILKIMFQSINNIHFNGFNAILD